MKNAIILCSGGLDSVTTAYYLRKIKKYGRILILFFNYGQRTLKQEKICSKKCAKKLNGKFIAIKLGWLGKISTSLINKKEKGNQVERKDLKNTKEESKNWYVPCRNSLFLMHALALAEVFEIKSKEKWDVVVGFKCEGNDSYPDTTSEYLKKINNLKKIGTNVKGKVWAPLIKKDKDEIVKLAVKLKINPQDTYSCYVGAGKKHCGYCLACRLRQEGFYWAGILDKTKYKIKMKDFRISKKTL